MRAADLAAAGDRDRGYSSQTAAQFPSQLLPHPEALRLSAAALREALALAYYGARGWVGGEGG